MNAISNSQNPGSNLALFQGEAFPVCRHTLEGGLISANQGFLDLVACTSEELERRRDISTLCVAADRHNESERYESIRAAGKPVFWRTQLVRGDGVTIPVLTGGAWIGASECILRCWIDLRDAEEDGRNLSSLAAQLLNREDEERRVIARRLHDATAQNLAALAMNLSLLGAAAPKTERTGEILGECLELTSDCLAEVRALSYMLHPPLLDELGLVSALRSYVQAYSRHTAIQAQVSISNDFRRLPQRTESRLFRVIQERLNYLHRHSDPTECRIEITEGQEGVVLAITDDADTRSLTPDDAGELGVCLAAMRERARQINAALMVTDTPHGTTIRVILARS